MHYLLDTNVLIAAMNSRSSAVDAKLIAHRATSALSAIVLHELCFGAYASDRPRHNLDRIEALGLPLLTFDEDDARASGQIKALLRRAGTPIGPVDTLIAGQAVARDLTLVTNNTREFARVDGLRVEDWTAAA